MNFSPFTDHRSVEETAEARAPCGARGCRSRPFWSPWPGSSWTSAPNSTWGAWDVATSHRRRRGECLQDKGINNDRKVGSYMMSLLFQVWLWITIWLSHIDYHISSLMMVDDNLQILWLWFQIWAAGFGSFGNMGLGFIWFPGAQVDFYKKKKMPLAADWNFRENPLLAPSKSRCIAVISSASRCNEKKAP